MASTPHPSSRRKPGPTDAAIQVPGMAPGYRRGDNGGLVLVGVIIGAHGIRGEVKLRSFTAKPEAIAAYSPLTTASGAFLSIRKLRAQNDGFIAVLDGIAGRDAAEALKGTELFVARARLPEPKAGEIYLGDLVGLAVMNGETMLGEVAAVPNFGAGDLLEVNVKGHRDTIFIPFTDGFVKEVDIANGTIAVELPGDFLNEEER